MSKSSSEKFGSAKLKPDRAVAGQKGCWEIEYVVGESGIKQGGGLRIIPPSYGFVLWKLGKVVANCSKPEAYVEVATEKVHPLTYHHSNYPAINIKVFGTDLAKGDVIRVKMGIVGGYNSGRLIQTQAQRYAEVTTFRLFVDPVGNAWFSWEKHRPTAYKEVGEGLELEVVPGKADHLRVSLRSKPRADGQEICVVAVEDEYENPISDKKYDISLLCESGKADVPSKVSKAEGMSGTAFNVSAAKKEVSRVSGRCWKSQSYGVSNPIAPNFWQGKYQVYFGDMHVMAGKTKVCSNYMTGTLEGALRYGRDVCGLDFTAVTKTMGNTLWDKDKKLFKEYNRPYEFVTVPAHEIYFRTGHKNVFYLDEGQMEPYDLEEIGQDVSNLWGALDKRNVMAISHHPNTHSETDPDTSWHPLDKSTINGKYERLIEICQSRGSFEKDQVAAEVYFGGFGSSIRDVLGAGFRLGFVGGTDSHRGRPGSPLTNLSGLDAESSITGAITGVIAKELTRESIWEALWARRCYATTCTRMLLDFKVNGVMMGQEIDLNEQNRDEFKQREIAVRGVGTSELSRVVVVRNGAEVFEQAVEGTEAEIRWKDGESLADIVDGDIAGAYYYAKVYQEDGNVGWASPLWLNT